VNPKRRDKKKMKLFKNKKALSPVVASIILIAVTVAVSIAVAAWMGALTFTFMATEQIKITDVVFATNTIRVYVKNTGTSPVTITKAWINGADQSISSFTVSANSQYILNMTYSWTAGNTYEVKLQSSSGNAFYRTETAPTS
jgi:flagellin-like protein